MAADLKQEKYGVEECIRRMHDELKAELAKDSKMDTVIARLDTLITEIGTLNTNIAAIKAKTDQLTFSGSGQLRISAL